MNSIERITAALNHQEADRVPAYPILAGVTASWSAQAMKNGLRMQKPAPMPISRRCANTIWTVLSR